ncbi:MAG TPA: hypothetical protein VFH15_03295 [Pyrinomonadaceae bacterium]|nr:hypothetical protein [Pyrinomonadaceae bacterium]
MTHTYKSEAEIEEVVRGFESCITGKDNFGHRDHLAVAVWYLRQDEGQALNLMRASLHRFLDHYDCRANYHETLTRFWILLVQRTLADVSPNLTLPEATNAVVNQLNDSRIAFEYYSKEVVESAAAKQRWLEPDLKKL